MGLDNILTVNIRSKSSTFNFRSWQNKVQFPFLHKTARFILINLSLCLLLQLLTLLNFNLRFHYGATDVIDFYSGDSLAPVCRTVLTSIFTLQSYELNFSQSFPDLPIHLHHLHLIIT